MTDSLQGRKVALLVTDGFEQVELTSPRRALDDAGATTRLVAPKAGTVQGMEHDQPGEQFTVDETLAAARPQDFDALVLPGGVVNPDALRIDAAAVAFVKHFVDAGKPIAAICHGPWTLIEAGGVAGRRMTSWPSLRSDLRNAGATWVDEEVVVDGPLVTSRKPGDLPAFDRALVKAVAEAPGDGRDAGR